MFLFFGQLSHAVLVNFSGYLSVQNGSIYVSDGKDGFQLKPGTTKARDDLGKFATGDYLSGIGEKISPNMLLVRTIDFVGLRRILGTWVSNDSRFDFTSFVNVRASSNAFPATFPGAPVNPNSVTDWKYSLAPGRANIWKMLISNTAKVNVAELSVNGNTAQIVIYNPVDGSIQKSIQLIKQ